MRKVHPGEPLTMPASTFNAFVDAAQAYQEQQRRWHINNADRNATSTLVSVRNQSGSDQNRFAVMGITGIIISPSDNLLEFQNRPSFNVDAPDEGTHDTSFVILQEPVANTKLGVAILAGISVVSLYVNDEDDLYAVIDDGVTTQMQSAAVGPARVLYKESGTGSKWAIVRFPEAVPSAGLIMAIWDNGRTGGTYSGHVMDSGGSAGSEAISWAFPNDPGTADLIAANAKVPVFTAVDGNNYGILVPWAAWG